MCNYKIKEIHIIYRCILSVLFSIFFVANSAATVRYVSNAGTASGVGTSWATASNDLQAMINASSTSDEIWVAKGTYLPNRKADNVTTITTSDRNNAFVLKADVKIYGGFVGSETVLTARNWLVNTTILSGDFNGDDAISGSGSTLSITNNSEDAYHVLIVAGSVGAAVLDGFTVKGGNANVNVSITVNSQQIAQNIGGGISIMSSSPGITNCRFVGNSANAGGGMFNNNASSPVVTSCSFALNNVDGNGGGIYNFNSSFPVITNCSFWGNKATSGGGLLNLNSTSSITNCSFAGNNATIGGGLYCIGTTSQLRNSIVWGNTVTSGSSAGIYDGGSAITVSYSIVQGGPSGDIDGNLNTDPLFTDAANGNLKLLCGSLAIDAGNNSLIPSGITTDLDGNARIQNSIVDMGAFEGSFISSGTALASATANDTKIQAGSIYYGPCGSLIAMVKSSGSNAISGNTTAKLWIDAGQPTQYVKRHYQITPDNNAATATGTVTLYFTQQEFNAFNGQNPAPALLLPTGSSDATGISNLRIEKRPGISSDGSGALATYTGTPTTLDPDDAKIVWNASRNRWEISFDVTGFSGFFVKTQTGALPVTFYGGLTAVLKNGQLQVNFSTATETNISHFEIEASADGQQFTQIGSLPSLSKDGNSSEILNYSFSASTTVLGGIAALGLFAFIGFRGRKYRLLTIIVTLLALAACNKYKEEIQSGKAGFIRIVEVDKDGGKTYSKVVKISEQ